MGNIFGGAVLIAIGLAILIYGMRIARLYAILSALATAIGIGVGLFFLMMVSMGGGRQMAIPLLIALAVMGLLLYLVGKYYEKYLMFYAILGVIKMALAVLLILSMLLHIQGGWVAILALAVLIAGAIALIRLINRWAHLIRMVGLMTDGAVFAVVGAVIMGTNAHTGFGVACAVLGIPLLIWTGLYHECWRQKLPFPGIASW